MAPSTISLLEEICDLDKGKHFSLPFDCFPANLKPPLPSFHSIYLSYIIFSKENSQTHLIDIVGFNGSDAFSL